MQDWVTRTFQHAADVQLFYGIAIVLVLMVWYRNNYFEIEGITCQRGVFASQRLTRTNTNIVAL